MQTRRITVNVVAPGIIEAESGWIKHQREDDYQ